MSFQSINKPTGSNNKSLVNLSKSLAYVLRHGAAKEGIKMSTDGFVKVDDLLKHKLYSSTNLNEIKEVVETNEKKRFHLEEKDDGFLYIRANQGHTMSEISDVELKLITVDNVYKEIGTVFHGTYRKHLQSILDNGLQRMDRNHIHCVNQLDGQAITSGMRGSCNLIIYIDIDLCLKDGIKWYLSANNVALTEGLNESGVLPKKYFIKMVDRNNVTVWQR